MGGGMPETRGLRALVERATERFIPLDVSVELTHKCNFRCQHCYIPDFSASNALSTERLLQLLEELKAAGTLFLTLTGGELFLRKDWYEIASRARQLGFFLRLFTNASLIDETIADQIASLPAAVEVSLYAMDEETFERVTRCPGSFRKTLRGIQLLRDRNVEVMLKVPIMKLNLNLVAEVFAYARRIGAECRADTKIVAKKNGNPAPLALRVRESDLVSFYSGPYSGCGLPGAGARLPREDGPLCAAGVRYCNITAQGDVLACNILPQVAGNIRESSFLEIWEKSSWLQYLRGLRKQDLKTCSTCTKLSYCGRCHAQALVEDGDMLGPSSWACAHAGALEEAARQTEVA